MKNRETNTLKEIRWDDCNDTTVLYSKLINSVLQLFYVTFCVLYLSKYYLLIFLSVWAWIVIIPALLPFRRMKWHIILIYGHIWIFILGWKWINTMEIALHQYKAFWGKDNIKQKIKYFTEVNKWWQKRHSTW